MGAASPRPRRPSCSISTTTFRRTSDAPRAIRNVWRRASSMRRQRTRALAMAADYSRGRLTPVARTAKMTPSMHPLLLASLLAADTLVVGTLADPVSLDPHRATDLVSAAI